ncbi:MAG: hypothetical protein KF694_22010 [Mesorhizobium sp.]|nr:hypothetical protein [Mesorhizobium sp.]
MNWRIPYSIEPAPIDGAQLLWSLLRSIEQLPPRVANPLRLAMPASPVCAGEEGDQVSAILGTEPRHA